MCESTKRVNYINGSFKWFFFVRYVSMHMVTHFACLMHVERLMPGCLVWLIFWRPLNKPHGWTQLDPMSLKMNVNEGKSSHEKFLNLGLHSWGIVSLQSSWSQTSPVKHPFCFKEKCEKWLMTIAERWWICGKAHSSCFIATLLWKSSP